MYVYMLKAHIFRLKAQRKCISNLKLLTTSIWRKKTKTECNKNIMQKPIKRCETKLTAKSEQ